MDKLQINEVFHLNCLQINNLVLMGWIILPDVLQKCQWRVAVLLCLLMQQFPQFTYIYFNGLTTSMD